jgi:uncharacterized protein
MTVLDLRTLRIRPGERFEDTYEVELEPIELGRQRYAPEDATLQAELAVTRTTSGLVFDLSLDARLAGPCFRCLTETSLDIPIQAREYHELGGTEELQTPYVADDRLDLSAWARDAIALALPEKILCRDDCAGLCPVCGRDLNAEPHTHEETETDPRWAALADLKDRL